jgi:hypothetical protein
MTYFKRSPRGFTTVLDPDEWKKQTKLIVHEGKIVCSTCLTTPRFFGWCSGAASYLCRCGLDQSFQELGY